MSITPSTFLFFFVAGRLFTMAAGVLVVCACVGFCLRRKRRGYEQIIRLGSFVLIVASAVCGAAFVWEIVATLSSDNPYEEYVFVHSRLTGPYWWAYDLTLIAQFLPQLFWVPAVRRHPTLVLGVAGTALALCHLEQLIVLVTNIYR